MPLLRNLSSWMQELDDGFCRNRTIWIDITILELLIFCVLCTLTWQVTMWKQRELDRWQNTGFMANEPNMEQLQAWSTWLQRTQFCGHSALWWRRRKSLWALSTSRKSCSSGAKWGFELDDADVVVIFWWWRAHCTIEWFCFIKWVLEQDMQFLRSGFFEHLHKMVLLLLHQFERWAKHMEVDTHLTESVNHHGLQHVACLSNKQTKHTQPNS